MKRTTFYVLGFAFLLCQSRLHAQSNRVKRPRPKLGVNLAGPCDWNTELPLVDVFRFSRDWISQKQGVKWGQGPTLETDNHGWVKSLAANCWAETLLCTIKGGHYPSGRYTVLYEGEGRLRFSNIKSVVSEAPGRMVIDVDSNKGGFYLRVLEVNPRNYIRNIRVIMPGFERTAHTQPWHPAFLKRWQGFACIRFMDFMHTNNSKVCQWADRPQMADVNWSHGLPVEMMCDLANRLAADPWFCMPHLADDAYMREFARLVNKRLDKPLKAHVEYSNEVWNSIFEQHKYAGRKGIELGLATKTWEAAWRYTGIRSKQMFDIWSKEIPRNRLVKVIAGFSINPYVTEQVLSSGGAGKSADVVAIAPYFSIDINDKNAAEVIDDGVEKLLDRVETEGLRRALESVHATRQLAKKHNLPLVAYEGGQHLVGYGACSKNKQLTKILQDANRHDRMGKLYTKYLEGWARLGGDLMCVFASVREWDRHGSWGLLQYADDDPAASPKFAASLRWAKSHGQPVNAP